MLRKTPDRGPIRTEWICGETADGIEPGFLFEMQTPAVFEGEMADGQDARKHRAPKTPATQDGKDTPAKGAIWRASVEVTRAYV